MSFTYQTTSDSRRPQVLSRAPTTFISHATLERAGLLSYGDGLCGLPLPWIFRGYDDHDYALVAVPYAGNVAHEPLSENPPENYWALLPRDTSFDIPMMGGENETTLSYDGLDPVHNIPSRDDIVYNDSSSRSATPPPTSSVATTTPVILTDSTHRCSWGACTAPLEDASPAGICHHLKEVHFPATWHPKTRTRCAWHEHGVPCAAPKDLELVSLGQHIAAVHLKTTACVCSVCERAFTRGDSLLRHTQKTHCARV
ncbi:hypothetical protein B0H21DRAFT_749559 [Amylocystis lapponica]|nr:hypothetical protein B0H21DRAFT_749559 [Amylocystis lapponica]